MRMRGASSCNSRGRNYANERSALLACTLECRVPRRQANRAILTATPAARRITVYIACARNIRQLRAHGTLAHSAAVCLCLCVRVSIFMYLRVCVRMRGIRKYGNSHSHYERARLRARKTYAHTCVYTLLAGANAERAHANTKRARRAQQRL